VRQSVQIRDEMISHRPDGTSDLAKPPRKDVTVVGLDRHPGLAESKQAMS
jgi:hypothetical protein